MILLWWLFIYKTIMTVSGAIKHIFNHGLDAWEAGEFYILVEDTVHTCNQYLDISRGGGLHGALE